MKIFQKYIIINKIGEKMQEQYTYTDIVNNFGDMFLLNKITDIDPSIWDNLHYNQKYWKIIQE